MKRAKTVETTTSVQLLTANPVAYFEEAGPLPPSSPMTPGLPGFFVMCEEGDEFESNPTQWQSDTWMELNFEVTDPHRYAYQYDSSGVGEEAHFTASAFGDLCCDGILSTFVRFGELIDGAVVPSTGDYIASELE